MTGDPGHSWLEAAGLPPQAIPHLVGLRLSLERYRTRPAPDELDRAFAAGSALAAGLIGTAGSGAGRRPALPEVRRLAERVPEFDTLLTVAADAAAAAAETAGAQLWAALGLESPPPVWTAAEREAARMAFGCACALAHNADPAQLRRGLRALAAPRLAERLSDELAESEQAWIHALGDRYASVRHRCAPRTVRRSLGLTDLMRTDAACRTAVAERLEGWLGMGGRLPGLAAELEAALVHARTPPKFA